MATKGCKKYYTVYILATLATLIYKLHKTAMNLTDRNSRYETTQNV